MYFRAGSDTEAKKAKGWFRNGIIGAFIILAVGVIILTIYNIVVNQSFFGGVPGAGPGPGQPPGPAPGPITGKLPGTSCTSSQPPECASGSFCTAVTKICSRIGGNLEGEGCGADIDCAGGLRCKGGFLGLGAKTCKTP